ncbi:MAG: DNA gyrase inhibitor YacG [Alphaproteobacteria bacterium]|nr:DNA gyrase inhibitor YacG [Alphaproteobacteria bacterium]
MSAGRERAACPICAGSPVAEFRPFCSARCKDEDLRRWLVGAYRIPAGGSAEPDDERSTPEGDQR